MKYYGKEKCRILKQIRAEIAKNNEIEYVIEECPYQGDCKGTCPKCEADVRELEQKLEERRKAGKRVIVAGVAAGMSFSFMSGRGSYKTVTQKSGKNGEKPSGAEYSPIIDSETELATEEPLMGDVVYVPEATAPGCEEDPEEIPVEMGFLMPDELPEPEPSPEPQIMGKILPPDYTIKP
ncbi:MAG: hypothetical protein J6Y21_07535 [Clostridia bacterium]|nr:hypothetical protein [Clostridia bacterium]